MANISTCSKNQQNHDKITPEMGKWLDEWEDFL